MKTNDLCACTQQAKIKDKWEDVLQMSSKEK
jgi:hypothetical protein